MHALIFAFSSRLIDSGADFCQAAHMLRLSRKFVAVLLAIWLPLFSANALAVSILMQTTNADCHSAQPVSEHSQPVSVSHLHMHHMQLAAHQEQQNSQHDQQNAAHKNCGVCQLACCGYLAAVAVEVAEAQPSAQSFMRPSTQFQSFTPAPLDPPPLARA